MGRWWSPRSELCLEVTKGVLVQKAKTAEQAECGDDVAAAGKAAMRQGRAPPTEDSNLPSAAYKNMVGARRSSRILISSTEQGTGRNEKQQMGKEYRGRQRQSCWTSAMRFQSGWAGLLFPMLHNLKARCSA